MTNAEATLPAGRSESERQDVTSRWADSLLARLDRYGGGRGPMPAGADEEAWTPVPDAPPPPRPSSYRVLAREDRRLVATVRVGAGPGYVLEAAPGEEPSAQCVTFLLDAAPEHVELGETPAARIHASLQRLWDKVPSLFCEGFDGHSRGPDAVLVATRETLIELLDEAGRAHGLERALEVHRLKRTIARISDAETFERFEASLVEDLSQGLDVLPPLVALDFFTGVLGRTSSGDPLYTASLERIAGAFFAQIGKSLRQRPQDTAPSATVPNGQGEP